MELPPPIVSGINSVALGRKAPATASSRDKTKIEEHSDVPENPPIAALSLLPIYTVQLPESSDLCPICEEDVETPTACQTGFVYCYTCIHKWVNGDHNKQEEFMVGSSMLMLDNNLG